MEEDKEEGADVILRATNEDSAGLRGQPLAEALPRSSSLVSPVERGSVNGRRWN